MITAYDLVQSANNYRDFLISNYFYSIIFKTSVVDVYIKFCDYYFENEFFKSDGSFKQKKELNEYELELFRYHPAFIEDYMTFKGYQLVEVNNV